MRFAHTLIVAAELYLGLGLIFALWFAARGAGRLDPVAARGSWGFRALTVPGAILLWPYLVARIRRALRADRPAEPPTRWGDA